MIINWLRPADHQVAFKSQILSDRQSRDSRTTAAS